MDWYDRYNVGVDLIDTQHKEWVHRISCLQRALADGGVKHEVGNSLKFLVEYIKYHFDAEEKIMQAIDYGQLEDHKKLHKKLIGDTMSILTDFQKGKAVDTYAFVDFMINWLLDHIRQQDQKIGKALAEWQQEVVLSADHAPSCRLKNKI